MTWVQGSSITFAADLEHVLDMSFIAYLEYVTVCCHLNNKPEEYFGPVCVHCTPSNGFISMRCQWPYWFLVKNLVVCIFFSKGYVKLTGFLTCL